jgi:uncharacterized membrane protein YeiH
MATTPGGGPDGWHDEGVDTFVIPLWADLLAVGVGGVQGALFASELRDERRFDMLGVGVMGVALGIGGGIIRDLLLDELPASLQSNWYVVVAVVAALGGMALSGVLRSVEKLIIGLDAVVIGMFGVFGTTKALRVGVPIVPAVFVGIASAVGGGILRDVLVDTSPTILYVGSLYAVAAGGGCVVAALGRELGVSVGVAAVAGIVVTAALRLSSVTFGLSIPEQRDIPLPKRRR